MPIALSCLSAGRSLRGLGFALAMLFSVAALAVDSGTTTSGATAPTAGESTPADKPKQCYNGCQRWGQMCNVDPRGVYRCQRRCEKFGEICE